MPGSSQSSHPHNLAGKYLHPRTAPTSHHSQRLPCDQVRDIVRRTLQGWQIGEVSLTELWGNVEVSGACAGSKRYLVGCLGGWGNVKAIEPAGEFEILGQAGNRLAVKWTNFKAAQPPVEADAREWGRRTTGPVESAVPGSGGW